METTIMGGYVGIIGVMFSRMLQAPQKHRAIVGSKCLANAQVALRFQNFPHLAFGYENTPCAD